LLLATALAFLPLVALGVWVVIKNRNGDEIARIEVPDGGSAAVETDSRPENASRKESLPESKQASAASHAGPAGTSAMQPEVSREMLRKATRYRGSTASWSPDSRYLVRCLKTVQQKSLESLEIVDLLTGESRHVLDDGRDPAWSPIADGPIAFTRNEGGGKYAVWISGLDGTSHTRRVSDGSFVCGWSPDGSKLYDFERATTTIRSIVWQDEGATPQDVLKLNGVASLYPSISPNGKLVAYCSLSGGTKQICVRELASGEEIAAAPTEAWNGLLCGWTPDSKLVAYGDYGVGKVGLWSLDVSTRKTQKLLDGQYTMPRWSPDGRWLVVDDRLTKNIVLIATDDFGGQPAAKKVDLTPGKLANLKPLVDDDFHDPRKSIFHRSAIPLNGELLVEDGLYIGMMRPRPSITTRHVYCDAVNCLSADFACQATGRVLADNDEGWSIYLHTLKNDRFVSIRLNRNREIEIGDAPIDPAYHISRGPFPSFAIRPVNEFNTLLVILRDGQTLEVSVNGRAVTAPIKFDPPLGSVVPGLAFWQRSANDQATVRAEFTRFTVWLKEQ
jgi:hypothetical protein